MADVSAQPNPVLYTRNGFDGPASTLVKHQYVPDYTRVQGTYAPRQMNLHALGQQAFASPRSLPVAILRDDAGLLDVEVSYRTVDMPFALRNVFADEVHVVLAGEATVETEFGILSLRKDDVLLIPRAVSYRLVDVIDELREVIYASTPRLTLELGVGFGPLEKLDLPTPWSDPSVRSGEYEVILRHGAKFTSVFFDYDPLPVIAVDGEAAVKKFNMNDLGSIDIVGCSGILLPPKMYNDSTGNNMFYDLSARVGPRPPIHYNADCDECILYMGGADWGAIAHPGTLTWVPKGFPHQGAAENVPGGYRAILMETRGKMQLTAAGEEISVLMETNQFGRHPLEPHTVGR